MLLEEKDLRGMRDAPALLSAESPAALARALFADYDARAKERRAAPRPR